MVNSDNSQMKELIIEKAAKLLSRYGYSKTTIKDIAAECGKTKTFIYHYFDSKEDIFNEVISGQIDGFIIQLKEAVDSAETPSDKIRSYIKKRIELTREIAGFYKSFKREYMTQYQLVEKIRERSDKMETDIIKSILKAGINDGSFTVDDTDMVASAFLIALKGFEYTWATRGDIEQLRNNADKLLNVFFNGIKA